MTTTACYTVIQTDESIEATPMSELKSMLEKGNEEMKIDTMKKILILMANGHQCDQLLMSCIRFVMPTQKNKLLKKLLLSFLEACEKVDAQGKLKQEMILVCNALRNDLQHPNEYVRGTTLRFVCKLKELELLEPLVPSVKLCLDHRHFYVRKNAVFAVSSIYKLFDYLIPDAPEMLLKIVMKETDLSTKQNAFMALLAIDLSKAVEFFEGILDRLDEFDAPMHLAFLEMMKLDAGRGYGDKSRYVRAATHLMVYGSSGMVKYESAYTLMSLSDSASTIRDIARCYIDLAAKESENNVKLIALYRLKDLRRKYSLNLDDFVLNLLAALSSSDVEVNKVCLEIILESISSRYVEEFVGFVKRELARLLVENDASEKSQEYRKALLHALNFCFKKFPEVASGVIDSFISSVDDANISSAADCLVYLKDAFLQFPAHRPRILSLLLAKLPSTKSIKLFRGILWLAGNFAQSQDEVVAAFDKIGETIGELPFNFEEASTEQSETVPQVVSRTRVLPDGTYATETALGSVSNIFETKKSLKNFLMEGNFFIGALLASCLVKLVGRLHSGKAAAAITHQLKARALLILCSIVKLGNSGLPANRIDSDSYLTIVSAIRVIGFSGNDIARKFVEMDLEKPPTLKASNENFGFAEKSERSKFDDPLAFPFIKDQSSNAGMEYINDLQMALGCVDSSAGVSKSKLDCIIQLTGFSDPVYAEAFVETEKLDAVIDILIVNQTSETLRNLTVELNATKGLKAISKPLQYNVGPHGFQILKASFKSNESGEGVIYGTITYDGTSAADTFIVNMREIKIDVLQMLRPSDIDDASFRSKWVVLEWENKINIEASSGDISSFLKMLANSLKMNFINVEPRLEDKNQVNYLVANLASCTVSGQDVLMNVCVRKDESEKIVGHCRIRSQLQGIVFSLGEKVSQCQQAEPFSGQ